MSTLRWWFAPLAAGLIAGSLVAGCGSSAKPTSHTTQQKPTRIFSGPAGLAGAADPQPNGTMWLLAGEGPVRTLHALDLATGRFLGTVPVSGSATAVAELSTGVVVLGTATPATGSLDLRNGSTGAPVGVIPIGAPVLSLATGDDGNTVYVLDGGTTSESVTVVDAQKNTIVGSLPVSLTSIAVAPTPSQDDVFVLTSSGTVEEVATVGGKAQATFQVGSPGRALALSPDGSTLYVLKGAGAVRNVAVVNLGTERVTRVLPAAADTVGIVLSPDGGTLYDVVGTSSYGNIQAYSLPG